MKKNDHNKESLGFNKDIDFSAEIGNIPNPVPAWISVLFKSYNTFFPADINEGLIEGYPIDDDF